MTPEANLPAIGSGLPPRDPLGHSFIKAYLGTAQSREKIRADIISVVKKTPYPLPCNAFKIEVTSKDENGFLFDLGKNHEDSALIQDEKNFDLQSYTLSCKDMKEESYSLAIDTNHILKDRCPCEFKVKVESGGREEFFTGSYNFVKKSDGKYYHVIDGDLPLITIKKSAKDYEVLIEKQQYLPTLVH